MLREYVRSGRVLVELVAMPVVAWLFFWPNGAVKGLDPVWFFSMAGIFFVLLSAYSMFAVVRLGGRPQAYVIISRELGRRGYLIGLYGAALAIVVVVYLLFSVLIAIIWSTRPHTLSLAGWLAGSLPLLLNAAIIAALVLLIAPPVLSTRPRLIILALLMVALSRNVDLFGYTTASAAFRPVQALLGILLLPALSGFALSVQGSYGIVAAVVLLGQLASIGMLLALALFAFERRELMLAP
jgi:hypothetical protein